MPRRADATSGICFRGLMYCQSELIAHSSCAKNDIEFKYHLPGFKKKQNDRQIYIEIVSRQSRRKNVSILILT